MASASIPTTDPKYAFHVTWNISATRETKAKALARKGSLKVGANHMLNKLLPEALEDSQSSTTGEKDVPVSLLTYLLVPPSSLDAELKRGALHWMLSPGIAALWCA